MSTLAAQATARQNHLVGYAACALAGTLWSLGFFFGKIAFTQLNVPHYVLYRFLFACVGIAPTLRMPRFSAREWWIMLASALFGIPLQFMFQFEGLKLTTVSHAALMVGTMPVILAVGATIFTHERLDVKGWLALLASTAGVALIVLSGGKGLGRGNLVGDLLVVLSLIIALGWVLLNRHLMALGHSALTVTGWNLVTGTAMLMVWVLPTAGPPPVHGITLPVWLAVAGSGLLCTATTTLVWNWGIHRVPAARAGVFLNIEPALGSILGVTLLGDHLGASAWIGGALIIASAVVLTTAKHNVEELAPAVREG